MEDEKTEVHVTEEKNLKKRKKRHKKHYLVRFAVFAVLIAGCLLFLNSPKFDIVKITVEGNSRYSDEEIIRESGVKISDNTVWLNTSEAEDRLTKDPFISKAEVKRQLPDRIHIKVAEREILAAVRYEKKWAFIDKDDIFLKVYSKHGKHTVITGVSLKKCDPGEKTVVTPEGRFRKAKKLIAEAGKQKIHFRKIEFHKGYINVYAADDIYFTGTFENIADALKEGQMRSVIVYIAKKGVRKCVVTVEGNGYLAMKEK